MGSGLIAGAADTDPTTVATLAVVGATTTYGLAWLIVLIIPMLSIIQVISAAVGVVCKTGLEDAIRSRFGRVWAVVTLLIILAVTMLTLSADLEGGCAALQLLTGAPYQWFLVPLAAGVGALLIWGNYTIVERILRYVLLIFLSYIVAAFLSRPDWGAVLSHTFIPHLNTTPVYITGALALLGTTLTSYAYVWETIQQGAERPGIRRLGLVQFDAGAGAVVAGLLFWFILISTGATLGVHHETVETAEDAARALAPLAGEYASILFGLGLLASALLALPVLTATSAFVMSEAFGWRRSLDVGFSRARGFYVALVISLVVAVGITLFGVSPIRLLFLSSLAGGLGTPVTLLFLMLLARDLRVMGEHRISGQLATAGWAVTLVVATACILFLWQTFV
ncbi:MAG TPA: divalent metal cation transporter [Ktedonobacterales bacterium]